MVEVRPNMGLGAQRRSELYYCFHLLLIDFVCVFSGLLLDVITLFEWSSSHRPRIVFPVYYSSLYHCFHCLLPYPTIVLTAIYYPIIVFNTFTRRPSIISLPSTRRPNIVYTAFYYLFY